MSKPPKEVREQLKSYVSKTTDEALDLVVNLTGKYIDEERRAKLKKETELEVGQQIEEALTNAYQIVLKLRKKYRQKKLERGSLKEKFYSVTDALFKPVISDIPKKVHAMEYLFQVCEELLRDFRFDFPYLEDAGYIAYLQGLEKLMSELKREHKINKSWEIMKEFKDSKDFYLILQATLQRVIKYYEFLARDFSRIKKKQLDKYLEIYLELSGLYEKFIALIAVLIQLSRTNTKPKYEVARRRGLFPNIHYVMKSDWKIFESGFNRNIRNSIAHKTCEIDILKETVNFIDRKKAFKLTFREVQKETRKLSALLLVLPHMFIWIFCLSVLSIREMLDSPHD